MKYKTLKIFTALAILFTNWSGFKEISGINNNYYRYSNLSGTITKSETLWQGRVINKKTAFGKADWSNFKSQYPGSTDTLTYRLFKINPLKFWRWGEYIFNWRYRLPYADWEAIKRRRGYGELSNVKRFQSF